MYDLEPFQNINKTKSHSHVHKILKMWVADRLWALKWASQIF